MRSEEVNMREQNLLFTPFEINGMQLKNRLVRSATFENMATDDGKVTDKLIKFYSKLAKGGVGLIVLGHAGVQDNGRASLTQLGIYSDDHVDGLKKLVSEIHNQGAKVALQIAHAGRQTIPAKIGGQTPVAPSAIEPDPLLKTSPREMTENEINATIYAFAEAAKRGNKAGFDAVQLHATHGYLLAQFLSPHTNRRTDEWGGSPEKRLRFVNEVFKSVREAVGNDYPILIKLSVEEGLDNGITLKEASKAAMILSQKGIDAIEISGGTLVDTIFMMCRGDIPIDMITKNADPEAKAQIEEILYSIKDKVKYEEAYWLEHAEKIKEIIGDVPLILVGGMKYPQTMAKILVEGKADLISLCRALIREPDFPKEMAEGRKDPAKCSFCNRCLMEVVTKPLKCYNLG
jgi:2,4-dienoyl-CoA reductase-like NADH-dependent reductase (Old Yellow Enzyme family)